MPAVNVRDLTVEFGQSGYVVRPLDRLSFDAADGELVAVLGPSGSGKTTLLSCLAGILSPTSGAVTVDGMVVSDQRGQALDRYRRHGVGIVFQSFNLIASLTARENVSVPLVLSGTARHEARRRADELLETVGLKGRSAHRKHALSGGEQQRVAIARALIHDPPLLVADEPTAHLDYLAIEGLLLLLRQLAQPGRTLIVATHDQRLVPIADRVIDLGLAPAVAAPETIVMREGDVIFEQGSRGQAVYVVESGYVDIVRLRADGSEERLTTVFPGQYFGELAPLLGVPRTATARAACDGVLSALSIADFRRRAPSNRLGREEAVKGGEVVG
jgi:putative ABC transport system ATP-binding protein